VFVLEVMVSIDSNRLHHHHRRAGCLPIDFLLCSLLAVVPVDGMLDSQRSAPLRQVLGKALAEKQVGDSLELGVEAAASIGVVAVAALACDFDVEGRDRPAVEDNLGADSGFPTTTDAVELALLLVPDLEALAEEHVAGTAGELAKHMIVMEGKNCDCQWVPHIPPKQVLVGCLS